MTTVHLSTIHKKWPYERQTPKSELKWDDVTFVVNTNSDDKDYIVVYDEPHKTIQSKLPKSRRILFLSEPPSIKQYKNEYLEQFGIIITPQRLEGLDGQTEQIVSQLSLPWQYGVAFSDRFKKNLNYDELSALKPPEKKQSISTIISTKTLNDRHRERIEAVKYLKENLGDAFELCGRGFKKVDDKAQAIDPAYFHLVCENNDIDNFWTEKLADAYLGWSFPIFSGCKNLGEYFPKDSFVEVDLSKPQEALKIIKGLVEDPDFYSKHLPAIEKARSLILNDYNLFSVIEKIVSERKASIDTQPQNTPIKPQVPQVSLPIRVLKKAQKIISKVICRIQNLPFLLPFYFKLINMNPAFFTDYYDRMGKKAEDKGYNGQRGQDWFLDQKVFKEKSKGFFLDVGANDPFELSNTLFFEKKGWQGLAFEPQERFRKAWKEQRKTKCLPNLLGANDDEEVTFIEYNTDDWQNALSGVEGFAVESGANVENIQAKKIRLKKSRLDTILKSQNIKHVDFMSLDVEGFEMEVLKGIDFNEIDIEVMVIENDRSHLGDTRLRKFVKSKGYNHIARLSGDDVFQKKTARR